MPRISNIVEDLHEINIVLISPFTNSKKHHDMMCTVCGYEWNATPISKLQSFKKHGAGGCPKCSIERKQNRFATHRVNFTNLILQRGYVILTTDYNGSQSTTDLITVKRTECDHEFDITPNNLIYRNVVCPVCSKSTINGDIV